MPPSKLTMNDGIMKNVRQRQRWRLLLLFITWPTYHITKIRIPFPFNGKWEKNANESIISNWFLCPFTLFWWIEYNRNDEFAVASLLDEVISKSVFFFRFLFRKLYFICSQWYNNNNGSGHLTIVSFVLFKWFHWFVHLNTFCPFQ